MKHFGDNIISFFKKSITQLEELQLQAELGKSELRDNFKTFKLDFEKKLHQIRIGDTEVQKNILEKTQVLKQKIEELELQFVLGKKEAKEVLENKINILKHQLADSKNDFKRYKSKKQKV